VKKGVWPANGLNIPPDVVFGLDLDIDIGTPSLLWTNIGPGANWEYENNKLPKKQKGLSQGPYEIIAASKVCNQRIKVSFEVKIFRNSKDSVIECAIVSDILVTVL
jgi:hypothetical protein